jgi:hypothetical protein
MWIKTTLYGIIFCIFLITGFQLNPTQNTTDWSEPEWLYSYPDKAAGKEFQVDVHDGSIHVAGGYRIMREQRFLEDSEVFYLQKSGDTQHSVQYLPVMNNPVEFPSLLRDGSNSIHFLWGARRQDPEFAEWKTERPQLLGFSTDVIYSRYDENGFTSPELMYEGYLREFQGGVGDILFPIQVIEDREGRLHTAFVADSIHTFSNPDGEEVTLGFPMLTYIRQGADGKWEPYRFLEYGVDTDITILPEGKLTAAYLGDAFAGQTGFHNVQVITSDDGGNSWSEPNTIFNSGQQPGRMLRLEAGPEGRVHLIWGRQTLGLALPNELWHSYSEDGAQTWTAPERFFQPEQSAQVENIVSSFDFVIDSSGRLHWAAVKLQLQGVQSTLQYGTWNPITSSRSMVEVPLLSDVNPFRVELALDAAADKLYLFWNELNGDAIFYSTMNLSTPNLSPVVATSGPLQLHANFPNPFNPSTNISFTLEDPAEIGLRVYDISGRQILQRNLGTKLAGLHTEDVNLEGLTSGTYIYEIEVNGRWRQQSTMMLVK